MATSRTRTASKPAPAATTDWRDETLDRVRMLIFEADPAMEEERKWRKASNNMEGVPVWSHNGIVCTGETYKQAVKLTFMSGAGLDDPAGLFNSSMTGGTRRAIDFHEGDKINVRAFKALIKAAVAVNAPAPAQRAPARRAAAKSGIVKLLAGGNPQIPKGDGDAPVQAYIAAMPEWKRDVGRWLDALITRNVPAVNKAVKWNSPFYGVDGKGWFLNFHVYARFVKVAFFNGTSLRPQPPGASKSDDVRYIDIHEDDPRDEAQMTRWVKQAAKLPGWIT